MKFAQLGAEKEEKLWAVLKSSKNAPWSFLGLMVIAMWRLIEASYHSLSLFDFIANLSIAGAFILLLVIFRHHRKKILLEIVRRKAPELYPKLRDAR